MPAACNWTRTLADFNLATQQVVLGQRNADARRCARRSARRRTGSSVGAEHEAASACGATRGCPIGCCRRRWLVEAALVLGPLLIGLWYSLHKVRFFQVRRFVGLDNYARVMSRPRC